MYVGIHVKDPLFLSDFNDTWIFLTEFRNWNMKFHENLSSESPVVPYGRTKGQTYMTKLIVAFRNFENVPKNQTRKRAYK